MTVFCDWLDATCSPLSSFAESMIDWASTALPVAYVDEKLCIFRPPPGSFGTLKLQREPKWHRVSASGALLEYLRDNDLYGEYLSQIGMVPYSITRLDAALDVAIDAPVVLRGLERRYPSDLVRLTHKPLKVTRMYSTRSDGKLSGTWYVGHRSRGRVTARVYDKTEEAFANRQESLPPTTRYELTFRRDIGCTLRDAYMPSSLFYEYASPSLVDKPDDVGAWVKQESCDWISIVTESPLPFEQFKRRVDNSPEITALAKLASDLGPEAQSFLVKLFESRITGVPITPPQPLYDFDVRPQKRG